MTIKEFYYKSRRKLKKIYIRYFANPGLNIQLKEASFNWKVYKYLKNKYSYVIEKHRTLKPGIVSNKIWWCWLQGEEKAPELCKACLNSLRKNLPEHEIIVITDENYSDYVELPDYIIEKYKKGIITRTHFSDILRLQLLVTHGGTWIDSSVLCTGFSKEFYDKPLFAFSNFLKDDKAIVLSNWFITSESNNPIVSLTRDLVFEYWKKNDILINYYFFHIFFTLATEKYEKEWQEVHRFSNVPPHILQFEITDEYSKERWNEICNMSSIHKLTQKADFSKKHGNSFYDYIIKEYGTKKK